MGIGILNRIDFGQVRSDAFPPSRLHRRSPILADTGRAAYGVERFAAFWELLHCFRVSDLRCDETGLVARLNVPLGLALWVERYELVECRTPAFDKAHLLMSLSIGFAGMNTSCVVASAVGSFGKDKFTDEVERWWPALSWCGKRIGPIIGAKRRCPHQPMVFLDGKVTPRVIKAHSLRRLHDRSETAARAQIDVALNGQIGKRAEPLHQHRGVRPPFPKLGHRQRHDTVQYKIKLLGVFTHA
jgi:hypothetical protein